MISAPQKIQHNFWRARFDHRKRMIGVQLERGTARQLKARVKAAHDIKGSDDFGFCEGLNPDMQALKKAQ
jgi:hypothetical protein